MAVVEVPQRPPQDSFWWVVSPACDVPDDARWFIDGSLFDGVRRVAPRVGFGIVVVIAVGDMFPPPGLDSRRRWC